MRTLLFLLVTLGAVLGGCSAGPTLGQGSSAVRVATSLPPPDQTGMAVDLSSYRIGPLDVIRVEVFGAPELTREAEVDAAGNFSMPLAGAVQAAGRTPAELINAIGDQLKGRYLRNPQISVNVVKSRPKVFTVDGAVKAPGNYPIIGKMTLQQAIATAQGADQIANLNNVVISAPSTARRPRRCSASRISGPAGSRTRKSMGTTSSSSVRAPRAASSAISATCSRSWEPSFPSYRISRA